MAVAGLSFLNSFRNGLYLSTCKDSIEDEVLKEEPLSGSFCPFSRQNSRKTPPDLDRKYLNSLVINRIMWSDPHQCPTPINVCFMIFYGATLRASRKPIWYDERSRTQDPRAESVQKLASWAKLPPRTRRLVKY